MATREMTLEEYHQEFGKPRKAAYTDSEAGEQQALFQWIETVTPREPRLAWVFHVPNGGHRFKGVAGQMKAMGVKKGVPDILMPVPSAIRTALNPYGYVGLAIELKTASGELSAEQVAWLKHLREADWFAQVYVGWIAAAHCLCWYLEREPGDMGLEATI